MIHSKQKFSIEALGKPLHPLAHAISSLMLGAALCAQAAPKAFPASIYLGSLNGANGFKIISSADEDFGSAVSAAGDVNGDGVDDVVIAARASGKSYVVFGKREPFDATLNLSSLNGIHGFRIDGNPSTIYGEVTVNGEGDFNGDGFADLVVGDGRANNNSGSSYVIFGKNTRFPAVFALSSINGSNGIRFDGATNDRSGHSVSFAGDLNGDGFSDLIIGVSNTNPNFLQSGSGYVVFGKRTASAANLALSTLDGNSGFRLVGVAASESTRCSVSSAGDVNGDGFADLIVGDYGATPNGFRSGRSYVVFGKNTLFAPQFALSTLDGRNGFRLDGVAENDYSGRSVSAAGDINGDGVDDLVVGAFGANVRASDEGRSYVVFGKRSPFSATLALSSLNGFNGFGLDGVAARESSGISVSAAGDINGDGIADLVIGAFAGGYNRSGRTYVVFGKTTPFAERFALSSLDGKNGFRLDGESSHHLAGISVSDAGDLNGDGFSDLIVGAIGARDNGSSGASYVVFGRDVDSIFKSGFE